MAEVSSLWSHLWTQPLGFENRFLAGCSVYNKTGLNNINTSRGAVCVRWLHNLDIRVNMAAKMSSNIDRKKVM